MIASSGTNCHLYHYANNNPITYIDPDGRIAFCFVTAALGAGIGFGFSIYKICREYNKTGKINLKNALIEIGKDTLIGTTAGLGVGLIGAQAVTSTLLQTGNCLASFAEVTGFSIAAASTITSTSVTAISGDLDSYLSEFSSNTKDLFSTIFYEFIEHPENKNTVIKLLEAMTGTPQNKIILAEMNLLASKLILAVKDREVINILKDIQDLTFKFGGQ